VVHPYSARYRQLCCSAAAWPDGSASQAAGRPGYA
jgi:hypothetical protein